LFQNELIHLTMKNIYTFFALTCALLALAYSNASAQKSTGINNTNPSTKAALHIKRDGSSLQGIIIPKLSGADTTALKSGLTNAEKGLMFYDSTNSVYQYWNGVRWYSLGGNSNTGSSPWTQLGSYIFPTTLTNDVGIGTNTPTYPLDIQRATDALMNISSSADAINTMAGLRLSMFKTYTNTQYYLYSEKNDNIANSGTSDFVLRKDFSTTGGYLKFLRYDGNTNDVILNDSKTTAANFGNVIIANGNVGIGINPPATSLHINNSSGNAILSLDAPSANGKGISFKNGGIEQWSIATSPLNGNLSIGNSGYGGTPIMINTTTGFLGLAITPALDALHLGNGKNIRLDNFAGSGKGIVTHNNNGVLQSLSGLSSQVVLGDGTLGTIASPWTVSGNDIYNSNTGGVGIGTSTIIAGYKLRVNGDGIIIDNNTTGLYFTSSTSIGNGYSQMLYNASTGATGAPSMKYIFSPRNNANTGTTQLAEINFQKVANQGVGYVSFSTRNLLNTYAERLRIDSEGNVGIGISSPTGVLDVRESFNGDRSLVVQGRNVLLGDIDGGGVGTFMKIDGDASGNFQLMNGNVGIGWATPSNKLHVVDNSSLYACRIEQGSATGDGVLIYANTAASTRTILSATGNSTGFIVKGDGNVGIGTTTPSTTLHITGSLSVGVPSGGTSLVTGNNNNFPIGDYTFFPVVATAAGSTITGFTGSNTGRVIYIHNYSTGNLSFAESSTNSAAGNRIVTGNGTVTITGAGSAVFVYWNANWRLVSLVN
jgi:hypothetical protein